MTQLEGKNTTQDPFPTDIGHEINYLEKHQTDFIILTKEGDFMQAVLDPEHKGCFYIEVKKESKDDKNVKFYKLKKPALKTETISLFKTFLKAHNFEIDDSWEPTDIDIKEPHLTAQKKSRKAASIVYIVLSIVILVALSLGANSSNRGWHEGFIMGILIIGFMGGLTAIIPKIFERIKTRIEAQSNELGIPSHLVKGRFIKPVNKKQADDKLLSKLEAKLWKYNSLAILFIMLWLLVFLGIAYLLQRFGIIFG